MRITKSYTNTEGYCLCAKNSDRSAEASRNIDYFGLQMKHIQAFLIYKRNLVHNVILFILMIKY